jgi:hypothetical protein
MNHVDAGHHLEQLRGDVLRAADAARTEVDPAGIGFGKAMNSGSVLTGLDEFTSMTWGALMTPATGAMSR